MKKCIKENKPFEDETNRDTRMLEEAIENNKPLEQIPKEMWEKMIF